jgi:hypothetical protein
VAKTCQCLGANPLALRPGPRSAMARHPPQPNAKQTPIVRGAGWMRRGQSVSSLANCETLRSPFCKATRLPRKCCANVNHARAFSRGKTGHLVNVYNERLTFCPLIDDQRHHNDAARIASGTRSSTEGLYEDATYQRAGYDVGRL